MIEAAPCRHRTTFKAWINRTFCQCLCGGTP